MAKSKKFNRAEMRAYHEGCDAGEMFGPGFSGMGDRSNPFTPETRRGNAWQEGFNEARHGYRPAPAAAGLDL